MDYIIVMVTAPDEEVAARIAHEIVEERLAGCVNITKGVRSIYSWEGKIEDEPEVLMIIKTKETLFESLKRRIADLHPYSVPEIISFNVVRGSEDYLKWLNEVTL
ncbi:MAG TPA: divalent-cation tolerance protein CutA [Nitrospirae bacterium]|nr:divalent-cation tolerance protein CutA [Nitrospirota bacterium]